MIHVSPSFPGSNGKHPNPEVRCSLCGHLGDVHTGPNQECRYDYDPYAPKAKEGCVCRMLKP